MWFDTTNSYENEDDLAVFHDIMFKQLRGNIEKRCSLLSIVL